MKNIIAITSLLAAGTLCANAEVLVDVADISGSSAIWNIGGTTSLSDYWAIEFELSSIPTTQDQSESAGDLVTINSAIKFVAQKDTNGVSYLGLKLSSENDTHWISNSSATSTQMQNTFSSSYFTVVCDNGSFSLWLNGTQQYTRFDPDGDGSAQPTASTVLDYASTEGIKSLADTITINGDSVSSFKVASFSAADSSNLTGVVSTLHSTIPEPSAFGLLAGLGALALAGTRRRRRK